MNTLTEEEKSSALQQLRDEVDEFIVEVKYMERRLDRKLSIAEELKLMYELENKRWQRSVNEWSQP